MAFIDQQIIEPNENYQTSIEDLFRPMLESMKAGDLAFFEDNHTKCAFYFGLSVQCARTNHIKGSRLLMKGQDFERYMRVANLLIHIMATDVGHSLIGDYERHAVVLLDNASEVPFVTADQPLINLSANPKEFKPPAKFDLYCPLSPTKAMILLESESTHVPRDRSVSSEQAHLYNLHMAAHSFRQVYSTSEKELKAIKVELTAFLSCF